MITQTKYSNRHGSNLYYQKKQSVIKALGFIECYLCSSEESLTIHHIVPKMFRNYFFTFGHSSYLKCPTVVLCEDCHNDYEVEADAVKIFQHKILDYKEVTKFIPKTNCGTSVKSAHTLLHINSATIKKITKNKCHNSVTSLLGKDVYNKQDLKRITNTKGEYHILNPDYKDLAHELTRKYGIKEIEAFWINNWNEYESKYYKNEY